MRAADRYQLVGTLTAVRGQHQLKVGADFSAIDNSSNPLTKSPQRLVTKVSPALTTTFPANASSQSGVPFFQWNPQAFAATYTIEIYKNGDTLFSPANKVLTATTKFSAWAPTTSLASGTYAWRVRRNDADGRAGPWSAARTFNLNAAAPGLLTPANGATVAANTLLFTWSGVPGAVQYRIEVAATCSYTSILYTQTTVMAAWAPLTTYANGSYCWRVRALNAAGGVISTSSNRTFGIGTAPPPPVVGTTYVPINPIRLLDTRSNTGLTGSFTANTARSVSIAGRLGIPATAVAITANLTVVGQQQAGYISVTPNPDNNPSTSALNFPLGDVRANNITSPLASDGKLSIVYRAGAGKKAHILLDVTGYFLPNTTGATYKTLAPVRLLDTRFANGLSGPFPAHTVRSFVIAGRGGVPANASAVTGNLTGSKFYPLNPGRVLDTRTGVGMTGTFKSGIARTLPVEGHVGVPTAAVAVTGNLTVVGQTAAGYVSMTQATTSAPTTSTLNFPAGDVRANGVTGPTTASGTVGLVYKATSGKTTNLILDITGYFGP